MNNNLDAEVTVTVYIKNVIDGESLAKIDKRFSDVVVELMMEEGLCSVMSSYKVVRVKAVASEEGNHEQTDTPR